MKRLIFLICMLSMTYILGAQEKPDTTSWGADNTLTPRDVARITLQNTDLNDILFSLGITTPRYVLHKVNNNTLLELDTAMGIIWELNKRKGTKIALTDTSMPLINPWEDEVPGRFQLNPHGNTYTLLDTQTGKTWEVKR